MIVETKTTVPNIKLTTEDYEISKTVPLNSVVKVYIDKVTTTSNNPFSIFPTLLPITKINDKEYDILCDTIGEFTIVVTDNSKNATNKLTLTII